MFFEFSVFITSYIFRFCCVVIPCHLPVLLFFYNSLFFFFFYRSLPSIYSSFNSFFYFHGLFPFYSVSFPSFLLLPLAVKVLSRCGFLVTVAKKTGNNWSTNCRDVWEFKKFLIVCSEKVMLRNLGRILKSFFPPVYLPCLSLDKCVPGLVFLCWSLSFRFFLL